MESRSTDLGNTLVAVGIVVISLSAICAVFIAINSYDFSEVIVALAIGAIGAVQGVMLMGFGKVINLLYQIELNTSRSVDNRQNTSSIKNKPTLNLAVRQEEKSASEHNWTCPVCGISNAIENNSTNDLTKCRKCGLRVTLDKQAHQN